tara:strand:+ start:5499 stop:6425 length:927 start_codon:yes stop_codon:yes gene_type:complete
MNGNEMKEHLLSLTGDEKDKLDTWLNEGNGHGQYTADYYTFLPEDWVSDKTYREYSAFEVVCANHDNEVELVGIRDFGPNYDNHTCVTEEWMRDNMPEEGQDRVVFFAVRVMDSVIIDVKNLNLFSVAKRRTEGTERRTEPTAEQLERMQDSAHEYRDADDGHSWFTPMGEFNNENWDTFVEKASEHQVMMHNMWHDIYDEFVDAGFKVVDGYYENIPSNGWQILPCLAGFPTGIIYMGPDYDNSAYSRTPFEAHYCARLFMDGVNNLSVFESISGLMGTRGTMSIGRGSGARELAGQIKTELYGEEE